ncbi:hypothetical protein HNS38_13640 [Lentimicrobium sp. L6]|uniref:HU domain-containing protein n=1 Tax=Lentimicrobium sp. L6 TaxID=2735916 RepID=UPI001553DF26|nr:SPOR domain-containing protein [Lentimicrobium sp. L6]NPD85811.1 hypothetical protein [Lentimicrobium sp. L6]
MMDLAAHIGNLVRENEMVIIPGLGAFLTNSYSSKVHAISYKVTPPGRHIAFNSKINDNDGFLAHSLVKKNQYNYKEALQLIETFADFCQTEIQDGGKISFENLGLLSMNRNGHIEFSPDLSVNYDDSYFGLPDIMAQPILRNRNHQPVITLHPEAKKKIKNSAPIIRRIAAIALPLMILSVLAWFIKEPIGNYFQQSASIISIETDSSVPADSETKTEEAKQDNTADISKERVAIKIIEEAVLAEPEMIVNEQTQNIKGSFHIICGAFGEKKFADKLLSELETEGFEAYIAGQNKNGLYRISAANFSNRKKAVEQLKWFQANKNKSAWLLNEEF